MKIKIAPWIFFDEFCKYLKNIFFTGPFQLENLTFKLQILNKFVHSIIIVDTLYLMSRNVDFVFYDT